MQQTKPLLVVAALWAVAGIATPSEAALIDGFQTASGFVTGFDNTGSTSTVVAGDAIGGTRTLRARSLDGLGESSVAVTPAGDLTFRASGCVSCTGEVAWNNNGLGLTPGLLVEDAFALRLLALTETVTLEMTVLYGLVHTATLSQVVSAISDQQTVFFNYSDFTSLDASAMQFGLANSVSLRVRTFGASSSRSNAFMQVGAIEMAPVAAPPPPPPPPPPLPPTLPPTHQVPLPGSLVLVLTALAAARIGTVRPSRRRMVAGS